MVRETGYLKEVRRMQGLLYHVDIVLCIDATGSMAGIIERCKSEALRFHEDLTAAMAAKGKMIDRLRVKAIPFRDYYVDGDMAMNESPFFQLPEESEAYAAYVGGIRAGGGGDEPESGLEALALAMKSPWTTEGAKRRHVIVVWTDATAHPLEKSNFDKPVNYPAEMPADFDAITDLWHGQGPMNRSSQRLIIYAPDSAPWSDIANHWDSVVMFSSKAGQGMNEVQYQSILEAIANSV